MRHPRRDAITRRRPPRRLLFFSRRRAARYRNGDVGMVQRAEPARKTGATRCHQAVYRPGPRPDDCLVANAVVPRAPTRIAKAIPVLNLVPSAGDGSRRVEGEPRPDPKSDLTPGDGCLSDEVSASVLGIEGWPDLIGAFAPEKGGV
jgi:hypothetical protein